MSSAFLQSRDRALTLDQQTSSALAPVAPESAQRVSWVWPRRLLRPADPVLRPEATGSCFVGPRRLPAGTMLVTHIVNNENKRARAHTEGISD